MSSLAEETMAEARTQNTSEINIRFQKIALIVSLGLFGIKMLAYYITNSNAILTDGLEGLVNIAGAAFGLYSLYYTAMPKDPNHPYGHGKIEFLSSGFEGILILIAGVSMILKAVYNTFYPVEMTMTWEAIALVAFAGLANYTMGKYMISQGKKSNSVQLVAGGKHLVSDWISSIGLLAGLVIIYLTDIEMLDNLIAAIFGIIISVTGFRIVRESLAGVMDEADPALLDKITATLQKNRKPEWVDVHNMRVVKYGPDIHLDAHVTLPWYYSLEKAHEEVTKLEQILEKCFDRKIESSLHMEPCNSESCRICLLENCEHRVNPFEKKLHWNTPHLVSDTHHSIDRN